MNLRGTIAAGIAAATLSCAGPEPELVRVKVEAPDRGGTVVPIEGVDLTLLPFDIDSLYGTLEQKNQAGPEPDPNALEPLYQAFTQADTALISADSALASRQVALEGLTDRTSEAYRNAFSAYERAQARRDSLSAAKDSAQGVYAPAREAYNTRLRTWESSAWDGFEDAQEDLYAEAPAPRDSAGGEVAFKLRSGTDGLARTWLAPGKWWIAGRVGVPGSVHQVYRWNVPFTVGEEGVTVTLDGENAKVLNTY